MIYSSLLIAAFSSLSTITEPLEQVSGLSHKYDGKTPRVKALFDDEHRACDTKGSKFDIYDMLNMINEEREKVGVNRISLDSRLIRSAQLHSDYQNRINKMTHDGPGGSKFWERVEREGYKYDVISENVAYNRGNGRDVVVNLLKSNGTYMNIINKDVIHFGAAVTGFYWTQIFASPEK